jgi:molybdopterin synthase sulfur carrier subunit
MPSVQFTPILKRFFPDLKPDEFRAEKVADLLDQLEESYPGLRDYLVDEQGVLRQHVNIFVNNVLIRDKESLQDSLKPNDEVFIMQALSGG